MKTTTCRKCGTALSPKARFCPHCGLAVGPAQLSADEVIVPGSKRLHVGGGMLSIPELQAVVEASLKLWQSKLASADKYSREQAASAIKELSNVLNSLSEQLAQGRQTVRITSRLPTPRLYPLGCPNCGSGNRAKARFCHRCGSPLQASSSEPTKKLATPLPAFKITTAYSTNVGQVREQNEDRVFVGMLGSPDAPRLLCLVADGMGGAQAGDVASSLVCDTIRVSIQAALLQNQVRSEEAWRNLLQTSIIEANAQVYAAAQSRPDRHGMGSTITAALFVDTQVHIGHVGDTRAFIINPKGASEEGALWMPLTTDHTLVARLVDIGQITADEARTHPQRNVLYRAVGTDPQVEVDTASFTIEAGDYLLICSDGLTTYLSDEEIAQGVLQAESLAAACDNLIALANRRGGRDNISVVLARVEG